MVKLLELVLEYSYNDEPCVNRWNYISSSIPAATSLSFALVKAAGGIVDDPSDLFPEDTLMAAIQTALSAGVIFQNVQARDLYNPADFYDTPIPEGVIGAQTGSQAMAGETVYGFYSSQTRLDIRGGQKRFSGVMEGLVEQFGNISTGQMVNLDAIAFLMTQNLVYTDEASPVTFQPVIISKKEYVTSSGKKAYKKYPTIDEQAEHWATGCIWTPYSTTGTQNTRKKPRR